MYPMPTDFQAAESLVKRIKQHSNHTEIELSGILGRIAKAPFLTDEQIALLELPALSEECEGPYVIELNSDNYGYIYTAVQTASIGALENTTESHGVTVDQAELDTLKATNSALRNEINELSEKLIHGKAQLTAVLSSSLRKKFAESKTLEELTTELSSKSEEVLDDRISMLFEELDNEKGLRELSNLRVKNPLEATGNDTAVESASIEFEEPVELEPVTVIFKPFQSLFDLSFPQE